MKKLFFLIFCGTVFVCGCSSSNCSSITIVKGPYVLYPSERGAEIRWESLEKGCAGVVVVDPATGEKKTFHGDVSRYTMAEAWERQFEMENHSMTFFDYVVKVEGLDAGKRYMYTIKGDGSNNTYSFRTAPPEGATFTFAVIGDSANFGEGFEGNMTVLARFKPDILIHTGDLQYYSHVLDSWIKFFDGYAPVFSVAAFLPVRGNHEDELEGELERYFNRFFRYPGSGTTPYNYAVQYGSGLFITLDSEARGTLFDVQSRWLSSVIDEFNSRVTDGFIVVSFHRPPYTLALHAPDLDIIHKFVPVFQSKGVNLVLTGHNHVYERFEIGGITYIVTGGGGAMLYNVNEQIEKKEAGELSGETLEVVDEIYPLRVTGVSTYHTVVFEVGNGTVHGRAVDYRGNVLDEFEISFP